MAAKSHVILITLCPVAEKVGFLTSERVSVALNMEYPEISRTQIIRGRVCTSEKLERKWEDFEETHYQAGGYSQSSRGNMRMKWL